MKRAADRNIKMSEFEPIFASVEDDMFKAKYRARCHCNAVKYEVCSDPVDSKICHCRVCQTLHGAPMQWAAIFHKHQVRIIKGVNQLNYYNSEINKYEGILPCKVSCSLCSTLIADEGRNMWLPFPSLFDFGVPPSVPKTFKPICHVFYSMRVVDMNDDLNLIGCHSLKDVDGLAIDA